MPYMPKSAEPYKPKSAEPLVEVRAHTRSSRGARALAQGVGGAAGGLLGSTFGQPQLGAGLGGAVTEAASQAAEQGLGGPMSPGAVYDPEAVMRAFNTQTGSEFAGQALGAIPGRILSPASKAVNRFLAARTENVVRAADQAGIHVNATEAMDKAIHPFLKTAQAAGKDAVDKLEAFRENFLGNKAWFGANPMSGGTTQVMPATAAHEAKEYFDSVARGIYKAKKAGNAVPADMIVAGTAKRLADQLRAQLGKSVPGYRQAMMAEAKNLGARRTLEMAARPAAYVAAAGAMHEAPGARDLPMWAKYGVVPAAAAAVAHPNVVSSVADLASNPAAMAWLQGTIANLTRAGTAATQDENQ